MSPEEAKRARKAEYMREWRRRNPERNRQIKSDAYRRDYDKNPYRFYLHQIKKLYGLTKDEYESLVVQAQGHCMCCGDKAKLVVDHCHSTKQVRGLICRHCNSGLGYFKDNPMRLAAGIKYLDLKGNEVAIYR